MRDVQYIYLRWLMYVIGLVWLLVSGSWFAVGLLAIAAGPLGPEWQCGKEQSMLIKNNAFVTVLAVFYWLTLALFLFLNNSFTFENSSLLLTTLVFLPFLPDLILIEYREYRRVR